MEEIISKLHREEIKLHYLQEQIIKNKELEWLTKIATKNDFFVYRTSCKIKKYSGLELTLEELPEFYIFGLAMPLRYFRQAHRFGLYNEKGERIFSDPDKLPKNALSGIDMKLFNLIKDLKNKDIKEFYISFLEEELKASEIPEKYFHLTTSSNIFRFIKEFIPDIKLYGIDKFELAEKYYDLFFKRLGMYLEGRNTIEIENEMISLLEKRFSLLNKINKETTRYAIIDPQLLFYGIFKRDAEINKLFGKYIIFIQKLKPLSYLKYFRTKDEH